MSVDEKRSAGTSRSARQGRLAALSALALLTLASAPAQADEPADAARAQQAIEAAERALPPRVVEQVEIPAEAERSTDPIEATRAEPDAPAESAEQAPAAQPEREAPTPRASASLPSPDELFNAEETSSPEPGAEADARAEDAPAAPAPSEPPAEAEVTAEAAPAVSAPPELAPSAPAVIGAPREEAVTFEVVRQLFEEVQQLDLRHTHDLRLTVTDARWPQAVALMDEGECDNALKLAREVLGETEQPPEVRYAVAKMQLCAGEKKEANETLRALVKGDGATARLARRALGLKVEEPTSDEDVTSRTMRARLDAAKKRARRDLDGALEELARLREEATSGWRWYQVRLVEAELLERADRDEDAGQVWLSIYLRTRDWRSGSKIEALIEAFEERTKQRVIGVAERVDRMRELIARGRYRDARKVSVENAKIAGIRGKEVRGWSYFRRALQAESERDREKADDYFGKAEALVSSDVIRPRLYFGWARALRRLDRDDEAIALYERLCEEYPRQQLCPDALYEAGRLLQYQNKHAEARDKFAQLVGLYPFHRDIPDALWRAAFSSYLQEDYAAAQPMLRHLREHYADHRDASELTLGLKAQYWLGVTLLKQGEVEQAARALQLAVDMGPLTWYGRLAAARLEQMGRVPLISMPPSRLSSDDLARLDGVRIPFDERLEEAAALARAGLYTQAAAEVGRQLKSYPRPEGAERLLAHLHLVQARPDLAHWTMKRHIDERGPSSQTVRDWGTAFPLHYMEYAHEYGVKYGVDPFLVMAIIRQESGFRPSVKSYAGAVGLMQLMPGTARYTARVFLEDDSKGFRRRHLIMPEKNVRLGTMYIRVHTAHASDVVSLALAGYNAGPAPLERWFEQYNERELDAWVESITYREARGYVRKVMTSYITYSGLYGDGTLPDIPLKLPEELRDWGEIPEVLDEVSMGEPHAVGEVAALR